MGGFLTYISLFSSAGIGCYGFKEAGFECIATNDISEKRLSIQKCNKKCKYDEGYILGDIRDSKVKDKITDEIDFWKTSHKIRNVDVVIATPPCQGMSLANHKKTQKEMERNSLVVESINIIKTVKPGFFIFENVRTFLNTVCVDLDGKEKRIQEAIIDNLSNLYKISYKVLNFKDYGCPSSRTRALVIGMNKNFIHATPINLMPRLSNEKKLIDVIGHLQSLKKMGEISENDIYHNFKKYDPKMLPWIEDLIEGESAFDNIDILKVPHTIKNGQLIVNKNKNGDKYKRQCWNKVAPCIHTRNDILSSQNTVHPVDNRVFSIRELMLMMSIPETFKWTQFDEIYLNSLSLKEKERYLKEEEMTIRHAIGEAVPTVIFRQIAENIKNTINNLNSNNSKEIVIKKNNYIQMSIFEFLNNK